MLEVMADALDRAADGLRGVAAAKRLRDLKGAPLESRMVFAATARCCCGAGLAYDPADTETRAWDCSAILLGTAAPSGEPGAVMHDDRYPFVFYEIKSERQPSANGRTTREQKAE